MTFLHPSIAPETLMGDTYPEVSKERREKYLHIIGILIDHGLTEIGITQALVANLRYLGDVSITEYLTHNEGDDAYERVKEAAESLYP
jgi:hypothetical protein